MRKHLYFYSSNLEQTKELRNDVKFQHVHEYDAHEYPLTSRNEYGRIKTDQNYYHILFGRLEQEGCPWCGSPAKVVKLSTDKALLYTAYCIQCMGCGARGPSLNVSQTTEQNKELFDECINLLWHRYNHRRAWDEGFVNPYELRISSQADEKLNSEIHRKR